MRDGSWADVLISDAVSDDGGARAIRLPAMVPHIKGGRTSYRDEVRAEVLAAVRRGVLVEGPVELRCPADHVAWSGPVAEVEAARARGCAACSAPAELLLVEETFFVAEAVARDVAAQRRAVGAASRA